jgi:hypothetical protein
VPTPIEIVTTSPGPRSIPDRFRGWSAVVLAGLTLGPTLPGCGGEPSRREVQNARAFEALLTAVSLKHPAEVERDASVIENRHTHGELSEANYQVLRDIVEKARARKWGDAESRAYEFRKQFGDHGAYFD